MQNTKEAIKASPQGIKRENVTGNTEDQDSKGKGAKQGTYKDANNKGAGATKKSEGKKGKAKGKVKGKGKAKWNRWTR